MPLRPGELSKPISIDQDIALVEIIDTKIPPYRTKHLSVDYPLQHDMDVEALLVFGRCSVLGIRKFVCLRGVFKENLLLICNHAHYYPRKADGEKAWQLYRGQELPTHDKE